MCVCAYDFVCVRVYVAQSARQMALHLQAHPADRYLKRDSRAQAGQAEDQEDRRDAPGFYENSCSAAVFLSHSEASAQLRTKT